MAVTGTTPSWPWPSPTVSRVATGPKDLWRSWVAAGPVDLGWLDVFTSVALPVFDGRAPPGA